MAYLITTSFKNAYKNNFWKRNSPFPIKETQKKLQNLNDIYAYNINYNLSLIYISVNFQFSFYFQLNIL